MKKLINIIAGTGVGTLICIVLAIGSIVLAFFGPERSGVLMSTPPALGFSALICLLLLIRGVATLLNRRFDSALLHLGCALVVGGWIWGRIEPVVVSNPKPMQGSMALIDGDVMNTLWDGPNLMNLVGKLDFSVKLEKFIISHYERSPGDQSHGRMPPVKEYRSRVTISYPDQEPYVKNIIVNHPVRIGEFLVYQMSWGKSVNRFNQPVTYTVLQFIRDPGLRYVYAGYVILFAGILLFGIRVFKLRAPLKEVK